MMDVRQMWVTTALLALAATAHAQPAPAAPAAPDAPAAPVAPVAPAVVEPPPPPGVPLPSPPLAARPHLVPPPPGAAAVGAAGPIRVDLNCESSGRTKACPAFLLGFIDANKVLINAPRAAADVSLYVSIQEVALADHVHLRFVGRMPGAPPIIEIDTEIDSRAEDDEQRAQLEPVFLRGISLFVAARFPALVTVALGVPDAKTAAAAPATRPWDVSLGLGGFGSRTQQYKTYNGYASFNVSHLDKTKRIAGGVSANGALNRQPPLTLGDGTIVSTNTDQWALNAGITGAWLYDDTWSFGGHSSWYRDDPNGQYRYTFNAKGGVEWDAYKADDPRGNRLAVLYYAGYQADGYNLRDTLGETTASYPIHGLIVNGSIRKDKVGLGVELIVAGEVLHPERRHQITAAPYIELKLGGHVDVSASFSITKRELPPPDPAAVDATNFAVLSRLSYAEPLAMTGSLNLSIHLDRTNGARNDRFSDL